MRESARCAALLLAAAALGLSACAANGSTSQPAGMTGAAGSGSGAVDAGGDSSVITGDGGVVTGAGGSTGAGGAGGAGAAGAGGGVGPPQCGVLIRADSTADFDGLPAGPGAVLRVRGSLVGTSPPAQPVWNWTVTITTNNEAVPVTTPDPEDPSVIEFPLVRADRTYQIAVTVRDDPFCGGAQTATTTSSPAASYWVRVMPPRDRLDLAPTEKVIKVQANSQVVVRQLPFDHPALVLIDPQNAMSQAVTSYVRITSPQHSWSREGDTELTPFRASLADDGTSLYDVLVVPTGPNGTALAPLLFLGNTATHVGALPTVVDPGVSVAGTLSVAGGAAVSGATVVLRAGALPSTVGTSGASGSFSLLARGGRFSAVILPPADAPLPEARLDADATTGIDLPASGAVTLGFAWRGDLVTGALSAQVLSAAGAPAAGVDVQLDSDGTSLPNVGTMDVGGGSGAARSFPAAGAVHRAGTTDATGTVSFAGLPGARYTLTAVPPVSSTDGITTSSVDLTTLTAGSPAPAVTVTLASKVTVSGTITAAPPGTRVIVLDDQPTLGHVFPAVPVGSSGGFSVRLDPQHAYHLLIDPPAGQPVSRVPLGLVQTGSAALSAGTRAVPRMVALTGSVTSLDGVTIVAGARVQVFCMGGGPDCVDYSQPGARAPLPLMEAVTDATGAYALWVPDPALP